MAFNAINVSPNMIFAPVPMFSFEVISNMAPAIPITSPMITLALTGSFRKKNAEMVINSGVHNISREA